VVAACWVGGYQISSIKAPAGKTTYVGAEVIVIRLAIDRATITGCKNIIIFTDSQNFQSRNKHESHMTSFARATAKPGWPVGQRNSLGEATEATTSSTRTLNEQRLALPTYTKGGQWMSLSHPVCQSILGHPPIGDSPQTNPLPALVGKRT